MIIIMPPHVHDLIMLPILICIIIMLLSLQMCIIIMLLCTMSKFSFNCCPCPCSHAPCHHASLCSSFIHHSASSMALSSCSWSCLSSCYPFIIMHHCADYHHAITYNKEDLLEALWCFHWLWIELLEQRIIVQPFSALSSTTTTIYAYSPSQLFLIW